MGNIRDQHMADEIDHRLDVVEQLLLLQDWAVGQGALARNLAKAIAFVSTGLPDSEDIDRDAAIIHALAQLQLHVSGGHIREARRTLSGLRRKVERIADPAPKI